MGTAASMPATATETAIRLRAAMESDERFEMNVDAILAGLGEHPWIFEPLRRHGVKAYGTAFLTPDELFHLGVRPDERLASRNGTAPASDAGLTSPAPAPWIMRAPTRRAKLSASCWQGW